MKMNLKSCLSEVDQCTLSPRKIQTPDIHYNIYSMGHWGFRGTILGVPLKREIYDEHFNKTHTAHHFFCRFWMDVIRMQLKFRPEYLHR